MTTQQTPHAEAWGNEPVPITAPSHPTGFGLGTDGQLVIGWQGAGREVRVGLDELRDGAAVRSFVGALCRAGGPGMTAAKADFLSGLLRRRVGRS